jgi:hypothetical protein
MRPASALRRLGLLAALAALVAAPAATAGTPTPPKGVRDQLQDPRLLLSLPADRGAWTLWSGTVEGDPWWMVSSPRAQDVFGAQCRPTSKALTVCFHGMVRPGRNVKGRFTPGRSAVTGRVAPRVATVVAVDQARRALRVARARGAYLAVARGVPDTITVVARDGDGRVVARRVLDYRRPRA